MFQIHRPLVDRNPARRQGYVAGRRKAWQPPDRNGAAVSSFFEDPEETLAQAKRRALTYLDAGDPVAAAVSMVSDMIRHPVL